MTISGLRPRLAALLTAIVVSVGLLSLSSLPAWAAAGTVTEFNVPGGVFGITAGPDGNLWFTGSSAIGRITPSGTITLFPVPGSAPGAITAGPDGNLWFLDNGTGKIGQTRIDRDLAVVADHDRQAHRVEPGLVEQAPAGSLSARVRTLTSFSRRRVCPTQKANTLSTAEICPAVFRPKDWPLMASRWMFACPATSCRSSIRSSRWPRG